MSESDKILESETPDISKIDTDSLFNDKDKEVDNIDLSNIDANKKEEEVSELKEIIRLIIKLNDDKELYNSFLLKHNLKIDKKDFDTVIMIIGILNNNVNAQKFKDLIDSILLVIKDKKIELIEIPGLILKINDILGEIKLRSFSKKDIILFIKILFLILIDLSIIKMDKRDIDDILKLLDLSLNLLVAKIRNKHKFNIFNCIKYKK